MKEKILNILEKLISYKSVTPKGKEALEYISNILSELGFICEIKCFGKGEKEVSNLYAIYGKKEPNICFAGHVDVVPAEDKKLWVSNPYKMNIVGNKIYGRGTVDMKGAIACSLAATSEYLHYNKSNNGSISFLLTTDEEGEAKYGTRMMLEHIRNYNPSISFCILGEPTTIKNIGDTMKIGRRGSVNFDLVVNGSQGHAAYPEKATNPLPIMTNILHKIHNKIFDLGNQFFQPTNLEIISIDTGNKTSNIIPESVKAKFNIRFNNKQNIHTLNHQLVQIISKCSNNYTLKHHISALPFIQKYSNNMKEFTQVIQNECKIKPLIQTGGGTSDARFLHLYCEVVEFGLNCNLAHKINEYTEISDLQTLYNVYYGALVRFL